MSRINQRDFRICLVEKRKRKSWHNYGACVAPSDMMEMQRAKEQNERLEEEIRVLRERVRSLDSEKRTLSEKVQENHTHNSYTRITPEATH